MHQGHNIPWNLLALNFEFKENDKRFTPSFSGLVSQNRPNGLQEIKHFIRRLVQAIHTFSETERAKYPEELKPVSEGDLFPDVLKSKYPDYLNDKNQRVEFWIRRAKGRRSEPELDSTDSDDRASIDYNTGHGDLADVVKILLYENQMEALLMMANHPEIPIKHLHHLSWGHHFGFSRVKESAVRAYMFFNSAEATGILSNGQYTLSGEYGRLLAELGTSMDFCAQQTPHQEFFRSCGVYGRSFLLKGGKSWLDRDWAESIYVHNNYVVWKDYMKTLFALMYRYDVLMCACGETPDWEREIAQSYPINRVVKVEDKWVEEEQQWSYELVWKPT